MSAPTPEAGGTSRMRLARLEGVRSIDVVTGDIPVPGAGEVLIRVRANSICGSDVHYFQEGRIGSTEVTAGFTPGHEFAGTVAGGTGIPHGLPDGTLVAVDPAQPCRACEWCLEGNHHLCPFHLFAGAPPHPGALAEFIAVPVTTVYPVPEQFTAHQAALLEPLGVAIHALDLAKLRPGSNVVVLGAGPIGLYALMLARISGALAVSAIEPLEYRRERALELGAAAAHEDVRSYLEAQANTTRKGADVVIEATTSPSGPRHATEAVRIGGRVVLVGIPDGDEFGLTASVARRKGLTIYFSRRMKNTYPRAIEYVRSKRIDVTSIVTHVLPLDEVETAFERLAHYEDGVIKTVIEP